MNGILDIFKSEAVYEYVDSYKTSHLSKVCVDLESFLNSASTALVLCVPPRTGKTSLASIALPKYWRESLPSGEVYYQTYTINLANQVKKMASKFDGVSLNVISMSTKTAIKPNSLIILDDPYKRTSTYFEIGDIARWVSELIDIASENGSRVVIFTNRDTIPNTNSDFVFILQSMSRFDLLNYPAFADNDFYREIKEKNKFMWRTVYEQMPPQ